MFVKPPVGVLKTGLVLLKNRVGVLKTPGVKNLKEKHRVGGWNDGSSDRLEDTKKSVWRLRPGSVEAKEGV